MDLLADVCAAALDAATPENGCGVSVAPPGNEKTESPATTPGEQVAARRDQWSCTPHTCSLCADVLPVDVVASIGVLAAREQPVATVGGAALAMQRPRRHWRPRRQPLASHSTVRLPAKKRQHDSSACGPVGTCLLAVKSRAPSSQQSLCSSQASAQSCSIQDSRCCS